MDAVTLAAPHLNDLTARIIGVSIEIHRALGSGLLEEAYAACLVHELERLGCPVDVQRPLPLVYKGLRIACAYRADLIVQNELVLIVKSTDVVTPTHMRELATYVRLAECSIGLLLNFGARVMVEGVHRVVNPCPAKEAV